ncbi:MAG TPA: DUF86 domain-containing protein [Longimicrobiaceae bacterium]|nr:DUF86 domain-containing protein [Longimicrobiaceae bacterium]
MKDDSQHLEHILECIRRIEINTAEGSDVFFGSHTLQDAVLRNLQTMAESTQRLSEEAKAKHPEVGWRQLAGFRNVLVHNYLGLNLKRVWEIIQVDLPRLKHAAETLSQQR